MAKQQRNETLMTMHGMRVRSHLEADERKHIISHCFFFFFVVSVVPFVVCVSVKLIRFTWCSRMPCKHAFSHCSLPWPPFICGVNSSSLCSPVRRRRGMSSVAQVDASANQSFRIACDGRCGADDGRDRLQVFFAQRYNSQHTMAKWIYTTESGLGVALV